MNRLTAWTFEIKVKLSDYTETVVIVGELEGKARKYLESCLHMDHVEKITRVGTRILPERTPYFVYTDEGSLTEIWRDE